MDKRANQGKEKNSGGGNLLVLMKKELVKAALIILLAVQFCLMAYSNVALMGQRLDCDTGKLYNHIAEMGRQKTLLLPDWDYSTTLEFDCSSVLALPFYMITHDIVLAFGLSNIVLTAGFISVIFFLFRREDMLYPLLSVNLLLIPFRTGMLDYYNMLYFGGGQYIIKAVLPLLTIGVLCSLDNDFREGAVRTKIFEAVCLGMLFLTSVSSGIYVAICGIFPVFAVYTAYKFFRWERIRRSIFIFAGFSCLIVLVGWQMSRMIGGDTRGDGMKLCSVYQMVASVNSCLMGMFELFGGLTDNMELTVMSAKGIETVVKCCFVLLLLAAGIVYMRKCLKKKGNLRGLLLLSVFGWNLFVLLITFPRGGSATYEYRYHLIGMLPLICLAATVLIDGIGTLREKQRKILYWGGYTAVIFLCAVSYRNFYSEGEQNGELKELCAYVKDFDVDHIYMYDASNDADICRVLDEESSYLCLVPRGVTWAYDYYSCYVDAPMQTENVVVVVNDGEYEFGDSFEIAGHRLERFDTVANRSLYVFAE